MKDAENVVLAVYRPWRLLNWALFLVGLLACGLPSGTGSLSATDTPPTPLPLLGETAIPPTFAWPTTPASVAMPAEELSPASDHSTLPILGDGVAYTFAETGAETTFSLRVERGKEYILVVAPEAALDPVLMVRGANGRVLLEQDDRTTGLTEFARLPAEQDETLQVTIEAFGGRRGGGEILVATVNGPFMETTFEDLTSVPEDDFVRYEFDFRAGQPVWLTVEPAEGFDAVLEVYAPDGFLLNRDRGGEADDESVLFVPESTGEYVVTVFGFRFSPGTYFIRVIEFDLP